MSQAGVRALPLEADFVAVAFSFSAGALVLAHPFVLAAAASVATAACPSQHLKYICLTYLCHKALLTHEERFAAQW